MKYLVLAVLLAALSAHAHADAVQANSPHGFSFPETNSLSLTSVTDFTPMNNPELVVDASTASLDSQCTGCWVASTGPSGSGSIALLVLALGLGMFSIGRRRA